MKKIQVSALAVAQDDIPETSFARQLRRADEFTTLAAAVAEQALAGLPDREDRTETGIFIGTAFGPLATNFAALDTLLDDGEGQMSPTLFSHSVFNTAAGYISRLFNIKGPAYTLTDYRWPFLSALKEGKNAVLRKTIKRAVVLEVEMFSWVLTEAGGRMNKKGFSALDPGAVAWILEVGEAGNEPLCFLDSLEFEEKEARPEDLLSSRPLDQALAVSRLALELKKLKNKRERWSAEELFGTAFIDLESP